MKKSFWIALMSVLLVLGLGVAVAAAVLPGDVNGDGRISAFDAQLIAEHQAGRRTLTDEQLDAAGTLSVAELIRIVLEQTGKPIAEVTNGTMFTEATSVNSLVDAVAADGNTVIKLLADIAYDQIIQLPYSCTLDLNGHTVRTNPSTNSGIEIMAVGSENQTTTIKNGTLVSYFIPVKVTAGAIALDNMTVEALNGPCVGLYDNTAYGNGSAITNSTLLSPNSCVKFMKADTDYSATTINISDSDLIASTTAASNVIFARNGANCIYGNVIFGDNVNMYSYTADPALGALENTFFNGEVVARESGDASVTVGDVTYSGMNLWTTEPTAEPIKILMIGNSFCLSFNEELYKLAKEAGKELYICNLYYGGCSVERHWKSLTGEWTTTYNGFYVTDALGNKQKHGTIFNIEDAIHFKDWDIISLQQHFDVARTVTDETALASCTPYAADMYDYLRAQFPGAKLYWHQTWAYEVGYVSSVASALPCPDAETQARQRDAIYYASNALSESCNVDQIPCGKAWEIARANPNITEDPCKNDKCHDGTTEGGQYLNACTWLETLFGISCQGSEVIAFSDYTLDAALAAELQAAAHEAVAGMYGENHAK